MAASENNSNILKIEDAAQGVVSVNICEVIYGRTL